MPFPSLPPPSVSRIVRGSRCCESARVVQKHPSSHLCLGPSFFVPPPLLHLLFFVLVVLSLPSTPASAYKVSKSVSTLSSWYFADRFCFVPFDEGKCKASDGCDPNQPTPEFIRSNFGYFDFTVSYPVGMDLRLSVFYVSSDEEKSSWGGQKAGWNRVYNAGSASGYYNGDAVLGSQSWEEQRVLSCSERYPYAAKTHRFADLKPERFSTVSRNNMRVAGYAYFRTTLPKFFFVAVSNCRPGCGYGDYDSAFTDPYCDGPLTFDYEFTFTNGSGMQKHFSYDDIGILELNIVFAALYGALALAFLRFVRRPLKVSNKYHVTVKIIYLSILCLLAATLLTVYHYGIFAQDGKGVPACDVASKLLLSLGELLLVGDLLLVAKGWTIVRRKISASGRVKLSVFLTAYAFAHGVLRYFSFKLIDKGRVAYEYETAPGITLVWAKGFAALWFLRCCVVTIREFPNNKSGFYKKFTLVFGLWFLWLVFLILLAGSLDDSIRKKVAAAFELAMYFVAHLSLACMYSPRFWAAKSFPFHSTSADDIMNFDGKHRVKRGPRETFKKSKKDLHGYEEQPMAYAQQLEHFQLMQANASSSNIAGAGGWANSPPGASPYPGGLPSPSSSSSSSHANGDPGYGPAAREALSFASVRDATEAIREAGDDVSATLHGLLRHLERLDDAMDDWDGGGVGEEEGEAYANMLRDDERLPTHGEEGGRRSSSGRSSNYRAS